ncbi:hypothetical protein KBD34_00130 [Patescibacteria group bacterium]|nr:hypothetical protein [Patescibacteria group bacterium]
MEQENKTSIYSQRPKILRDVSPDFDWDREKIWQLTLPVQEVEIKELLWHFDLPFWEKEGTDDWNLTPWEVISDPNSEPSHYRKVQNADTSYPLDVILLKDRYRILDGLHRLANCYLRGDKVVKVRVILPEQFELIKK